MTKNFFDNAICGTKFKLRNGGFAFYVNRTLSSFSHSGSYLLAHNGDLFEYDSLGRLMFNESVNIDYLPTKELDPFQRNMYDIIERID